MAAKVCTACKQSRPTSEFNRRARSADGLQNVCRACNRQRARRYYAEHREAHIRTIMGRKAARRAACLEVVGAHLLANPCVDCGEADPRVLDFDHREGVVKDAEVLRLAQDGYAVERVRAEIAKCDVRCRNCHAKVTYARQGLTWRDRLLEHARAESGDVSRRAPR